MGAGAVVALVAASLFVTATVGRPSAGGEAVDEAPVAAAGFPDVGVAENVYEPGHTSGWHTHPGVHSAVVLSGTLTVYDAECVRHEFHAGETYLGGQDPHLARNETGEPVGLVVTYVFRPVPPLEHATAVPAPAGCAAG